MVKNIYLTFYCLLFGLKIFTYSLVLVHLGPELPSYMYDCLYQTRLFNDCEIFLIANQVALNKYNDPKNLRIILIQAENLVKTKTHLKFIKESSLDREGLGGFWYFASERFFYLDDFIQQYNKEDVIHIENDTLIYVDLKTLIPILKESYPGMAAVFDHDRRCIPCFIYFSNKNSSSKLAKFFTKHANEQKNDMEILALFRKQHKDIIDNLPIIMPHYEKAYGLLNSYRDLTKKPHRYWKNIEKFNSIFDGAALGQYLGGISPANGPSMPGFINETCLFNPSLLTFIWKYDSSQRKIPYVVFNNESYRINNLHIHSKNLAVFLSKEK